MSASRAEVARLQRIGWGLLLSVCAAATLNATLRSPDFPFITRSDAAPWIAAPLPQTTNLIAVDPQAPPLFTFVHRFSVEHPGEARITGRALRHADVVLNGVSLQPELPITNWKDDFRLSAPDGLRSGRNEIRVAVHNAHGPPLLRLVLEGPNGFEIATGEAWQVVPARGTPAPAVLARDRSVLPEAAAYERPLRAVLDAALPLLLCFVTLTALAAFLDRRLGPEARSALPQKLLWGISGLWLTLFAYKFVRLPLLLGFDVPAHLHYVASIVEGGRLPLAHEGFSSYHPPLFHALTAAFAFATDTAQSSAAAQFVYRIVPFAAGLANVWLTHAVARRLWPDAPIRIGLAVCVAGLLPMNVYMSAYVSNEPLHAAWVSLALLLATCILVARRVELRLCIALGVCLGAGLLTKFTSLLVAPVVVTFVFARLWLADGRGPIRAGTQALGVLVVAALLSGWFYVRNWLTYGDALVWNLDIPGAATWYMQPGFHTLDYYVRFGEALSHPYFAGFASFWDGVYSTLWGDGLVAGMIRVETRHTLWNYEAMAAVGILALPATPLFAGGLVRLLRCSFFEDDVGRRLAVNLVCVTLCLLAFSLFYITLRLPFYAQARAPYVLSGILPLAIVGSAGLAYVPERLRSERFRIARALYYGWLGTLGTTITVAFLG